MEKCSGRKNVNVGFKTELDWNLDSAFPKDMIAKLKCSFIQMENLTGKSFYLFLAKVMWTHSKKWKKWFYYFYHSLLYFLSSKVSNNIPTSTREINMITAIILLPQMSSCKTHLINTHIHKISLKNFPSVFPQWIAWTH